MGKEELEVIMESAVSYALTGEGLEPESGKAKAKIDEENISILPESGNSMIFPLRDIIRITAEEYKIYIRVFSGEEAVLSGLGYQFEDFMRVLSGARNELLLKDMLMNESIRKSGIDGVYTVKDKSGSEKETGKCELKLGETGIIIIPEKDEIRRVPYCDVIGFEEKDCTLSLRLETGEGLILSRMVRRFDAVKKTISDSMNELSEKVQSCLKELVPDESPLVLRKVSFFMREGKAARRSDIEGISAPFFLKIEEKIAFSGIKDEYRFLKDMSRQEKICVGLKRGLMGDLTKEYIWFLIPLYGTDKKKMGNAVAMESIIGGEGENGEEEEKGRATYFFRIMGRKEYAGINSMEELDGRTDAFIETMNRCMLAINFRREPIYLPEEKLQEPRYVRYRYAIRKIPSLGVLRNLFIGRVIHSSCDQWKKDVNALLEFNGKSTDDSAGWHKE